MHVYHAPRAPLEQNGDYVQTSIEQKGKKREKFFTEFLPDFHSLLT